MRSGQYSASIRSQRFEWQMGKNKKNRIKIGGLERQIDYHNEKIDEEMRRHNPNKGLIKHW
jgi:hypothetical protein